MNPIKKVTLLLGATASAVALHAQTSTSPTLGVLGQSYSELSLGIEDLRNTSDNAYQASIRGNKPVSPNIDVGFGYGYSWLNSNTDIHSHLLAVDSKFYAPMGNQMKPFLGGTAGYQWVKTHFDNAFPPITTDDDRFVWGLSAGVEMPVGTVALTPHIGYVDTMEGNSLGHYNYGVEVHHWFTPAVGGYADVGYNELRHQANTWTYLAGVRMKF